MGCNVGIFGMALKRLGEFSKFLRWGFWTEESCAGQARREARRDFCDSLVFTVVRTNFQSAQKYLRLVWSNKCVPNQIHC